MNTLTLPPRNQAPDCSPPWMATLMEPRFWPDGPEAVELIETHISWVFLTRRFAFKLKKPVAFDFLDFRSLAARKQACEDEIRLNRRLAGNIYLGVVPITESLSGEVALDGSGQVVDYMVKMTRLPKAQRLDVRIEQKTLAARDIDPLVRTLSAFYQASPPLMLRPDAYLAQFEQQARDNRQALLAVRSELPQWLVERATSAQLTVLKLYAEIFRNRVRDGRLIEGHGDLRPEHIYLTSAPVVVDCIEFNAAFRQIDVADELAFLAMECDTLQAGELGEQIVQRCFNALDDHPSEMLLAFYKSYRATVRAKVAALRANQQPPGQRAASLATVERDLRLAIGYLRPWISPLLIVVGGLMGSGKSTLAGALTEALGFEHLQTDALRRELQGSADTLAEYGEGKYSSDQRALVYRALLERAKERLSAGLSVVLDGTFIERAMRDEAVELARQCGARSLLVWCVCPGPVAKARIAARRESGAGLSQARPELLNEQLLREELPVADESPLEFDSTAPWQVELAQLFQILAGTLEGATKL